MTRPHLTNTERPLNPISTSADALNAIPTLPGGKAALVIAHPGHELRVHRWLELARPVVFTLTDGSGHIGQSRLSLTTGLLERLGAQPGGIYGRFTDAELYAAILDHNFDLFGELVEELALAFVRERIEYVAGDALEGYNPVHDVCRHVIDTAVKVARQRGQPIASFDFLLVGQPDVCPEELLPRALRLELGEAALERKLEAVRAYPQIATDAAAAFSQWGTESFRIEYLRPASGQTGAEITTTPFYEEYGEQQVAAGYYKRVLRYREHVAPLAEALCRYAEEGR